MDVAARIEALEAENERLRDRIAQLETEQGMRFLAPLEWRLTGSEARVFGVLMVREVASKESIMNGVYTDITRDEAQIKIIDVFVCKLRRKLKPFAVSIETQWGAGYYLTPATKAQVRTMLTDQVAA